MLVNHCATRILLSLSLYTLAACGEAAVPEHGLDGGLAGSTDAATSTPSTSSTGGSNVGTSTGTSVTTSSTGSSSLSDGGVGPAPMSSDEFLNGLFGDGGLFGGPTPTDNAPPPDVSGSGGWTLKADSSPECPPEPPPTPIDPCLGVYWSCGWEHSDGSTYTCVCDWIHYLCI